MSERDKEILKELFKFSPPEPNLKPSYVYPAEKPKELFDWGYRAWVRTRNKNRNKKERRKRNARNLFMDFRNRSGGHHCGDIFTRAQDVAMR